MSTRTVYTTTITVPIYASWKCHKCGTSNYSLGEIVYNGKSSSGSFFKSKHETAKKTASDQALSNWKDNAIKIIYDPRNNTEKIRNYLSVHYTNCSKCNTKPKWDKGTKYLVVLSLSLAPTLISGLVAICMLKSVVAWLIFAVFLGLFLYPWFDEKAFKKTMQTIPNEYLPIIGSLNKELVDYAEHRGKTILTPDETKEAVLNPAFMETFFSNATKSSKSEKTESFKINSQASIGIEKEKTEGVSKQIDLSSDQSENRKLVCEKCGKPLLPAETWCKWCGNKVEPVYKTQKTNVKASVPPAEPEPNPQKESKNESIAPKSVVRNNAYIKSISNNVLSLILEYIDAHPENSNDIVDIFQQADGYLKDLTEKDAQLLMNQQLSAELVALNTLQNYSLKSIKPQSALNVVKSAAEQKQDPAFALYNHINETKFNKGYISKETFESNKQTGLQRAVTFN